MSLSRTLSGVFASSHGDTEALRVNHCLTLLKSSAAAYQNPNPRGSYFTPIEGLAQERGDVTLVFVYANFVQSFTPIDDPIYSAHKEIPYPDTTPAYAPNFPISTLGCIEKVRPFCSTKTACNFDLLTNAVGVLHSKWQRAGMHTTRWRHVKLRAASETCTVCKCSAAGDIRYNCVNNLHDRPDRCCTTGHALFERHLAFV